MGGNGIMDIQLAWIARLLNDAGIKYWVDSGTLLGLVRDGKLLDHDRDIDISMWSSSIDGIEGLLSAFRSAGYGIQKASYFGDLFEVKLFPCGCEVRSIDIKIFRCHNGYAWCPCTVHDEDYTKSAVISMLKKKWWAPWKAIGRVYWMTLRNSRRKRSPELIEVDKNPWRRVYRMRTWLIPESLLKTQVYDKQLNVWVPSQADEYLQYRYGNWRVPTEDWSYTCDDGGLSLMCPARLGFGRQ